MKSYYFTVLLFLIFPVSSYSQVDKFTGYATALVNQDGILKIETFGYADKEKRIKYSDNTVQPIGSVSKTFIGISLMIAIEKGLLDLDKDINEYLDFKIQNPNFDDSNIITLRHLATHTSGLIDNAKIYESAYSPGLYPSMDLKEFLLENLVKNKKNVKKSFYKSKAGKRYAYSNIGAALAAYIIETTSEKPFDEFTNEYIFTPLRMENTGWFYKDINQNRHAILYDEKGNPLKPYSLITYPDGNLKTSIVDLSQYLIELIKGYNGNSKLLAKDSWIEFFTKNFEGNSTIKNLDLREPDSGIFVVYFKSGKIGHTGSDPGVSTILMFDPKTNIGQIFMSNKDLVKDNLQEFKTIWSKIK